MFSEGIKAFQKEVDEAKVETKKDLAKEVLTFLNSAGVTPVRTGALVAHWFARTGEDFPEFDPDRTDTSRDNARSRESAVIDAIDQDTTIFIGNTAPYAQYVNDGVGPEGQARRAWAMVEQTLTNYG